MSWPNKVISNLVAKELKSNEINYKLLSGDASSRRFYRVFDITNETTFILMRLDKEDGKSLFRGKYPWIPINRTLQKHSILVPQIVKIFDNFSCILITDLGSGSFSDSAKKVRGNTRKTLEIYDKATDIAATFLNISSEEKDGWSHRKFTAEKYSYELSFFWNNFIENSAELKKNLDYKIFLNESKKLSETLVTCNRLFFCHRDFHSRNLMTVNNKIGVIDFQDARFGNIGYDICSLCFDPYVKLDYSFRLELLDSFIKKVSIKHGEQYVNSIQESWKAVGIQRLFKAIGSYAFLSKNGKTNFSKYIKPTFKILEQIAVEEKGFPYLTKELIPKGVEFSLKEKQP